MGRSRIVTLPLDEQQFDTYHIVEPMDAGAKKLVRMFKALGHPNRYRLFAEIREGGERAFEEGHVCFLNDILDRLNVGAPTVSHHLKELVEAQLITTDRQGKYVTCRVNPDALVALRGFFDSKK